jgi:ABC-type sulfate/molybdate transport systems ATPase subunit
VNKVILKSEKLCKQFGLMAAVKDVSLEFYEGEIHGLIGENGSGKSTFCSMLCGIYSISSGRFLLNGKCWVSSYSIILGIVAAIAAGALMGAFNGFFHVKFKIASFIRAEGLISRPLGRMKGIKSRLRYL